MIFVSHRETDSVLAKALVEFLRAALDRSSEKIRCTSVPGFQLPFGKTISAQLREDIGASSAVFVLITRASLQSRWVLFELGAAWALGKVIVPVLSPGLSQSDLPGPLQEYPAISSDDANATARLRDAVAQIAAELALTETGGGEPQRALEFFMRSLHEWAPAVPPEMARALAFQVGWLLTLLLIKQAAHPSNVMAQVESHAAELGLRLPPTWRDELLADDVGAASEDVLYELGGQLIARHPDLAPYFEAGVNILRKRGTDEATLGATISKLDLPKSLRDPSGDKLAWINRVHEHFQRVLHGRVTNYQSSIS